MGNTGKAFFRITMLPAGPGDALWIEYGHAKEVHRVLIDGGTLDTSRELKKRLTPDVKFDLIVITHIDGDHIGGILKALADDTVEVHADDVWFNAWRHLPGAKANRTLGGPDGEYVSKLLEARKLNWNAAFGGNAVSIGVGAAPLPVKTLAGGMKLTLLSPSSVELKLLAKQWSKDLAAIGLTGDQWNERTMIDWIAANRRVQSHLLGGGLPDIATASQTPFEPDGSPTNRSSIAMVAEYAGKAILLTGDADARLLNKNLRRLRTDRPDLTLSALKVAHHGSNANTSSELVEAAACPRFLFSSDGSTPSKHPNESAVSRIVACSPGPVELYFNYESQYTKIWKERVPGYRYTAFYPEATAGLREVAL